MTEVGLAVESLLEVSTKDSQNDILEHFGVIVYYAFHMLISYELLLIFYKKQIRLCSIGACPGAAVATCGSLHGCMGDGWLPTKMAGNTPAVVLVPFLPGDLEASRL